MTKAKKIVMLNQEPNVEITFEYLGQKTPRLFITGIKEDDKILLFDKYWNSQRYAGTVIDEMFKRYGYEEKTGGAKHE